MNQTKQINKQMNKQIKILFLTYLTVFISSSLNLTLAQDPQCLSESLAEKTTISIQELNTLKNQGKKIFLVVGRKYDEEGHPPPSQDKESVWVYVDKDAPIGPRKPEDPLQLVMNFEDGELIKEIGDQLFSKIIFDLSVWKNFLHRENDLIQYHRMLKQGGSLYFERSHKGGFIGFKAMEPLSQFVGGDGFTGHLIINNKYQLVTMHFIPLSEKQEHQRVMLEAWQKIEADTIKAGLKAGFTHVDVHRNKNYPIVNSTYKSRQTFFEMIK